MQRRSKLFIGLLCLFAFPLASASEPLPRPAGLDSQVTFWKQIYSEVDTNSGLIHDSRHLNIVYEKIQFKKRASQRSHNKLIKKTKAKYAAALRSLGRGKRTHLSTLEKRVLALWPSGVSNGTLRAAARRLRFQLGQSDKFRAGLIRAGAWRPYIDQVFAEYGIPPEIAALPHVESSFNPAAYSRIGAAGLWQFTRGTGRLFLHVDYAIDERLDPFKSSVAAAKLLQSNYRALGSWPLAITAYNHGVGGMKRAGRKMGTKDITQIVDGYKSRTFGFASRNFYAELLAASEVEQNAETYFGKLSPHEPIHFESVTLSHYYPANTLAKALGISTTTLRTYNPSLRSPVFSGQKYVPKSFVLHLPESLTVIAANEALSNIPKSQRFNRQHRDKYYRVRRGDTLSTIARRVRVRESELMAANNLRNRHYIRAGQILLLPGFAKTPAPARPSSSNHATLAQAPVHRGSLPASYKVGSGDTLSSIAKHFEVSLQDLYRANKFRNHNRIYPGQVINLPENNGSSIQVAKHTSKSAPTPKATPKPSSPEKPVAVAMIGPPAPAASPSPNAPNTIPNFDASTNRYAVHNGDTIDVEAEETVGHYAEWLGVSASNLRKLNRMRYSTPLVIGRHFRLNFSKVSHEDFEQERLEYHRSLQEDFFTAYHVSSTSEHKLENGETLWSLSRGEEPVPIWLLIQYNPDLDFNALHPGMRVTVPQIEPRRS